MNNTNRLPISTAGYWISPNNHFFTVEQHIFSVCDFPECFGTDASALRAVFKRFGEPYRTELKAREAIIKMLVRNGWIRLRHYIRRPSDQWTVNMPSHTPESLARVCAFMKRVYAEDVSYTPVALDSPEGRTEQTVAQLVANTPAKGLVLDVLPRLIYLESPAKIPLDGIPPLNLMELKKQGDVRK